MNNIEEVVVKLSNSLVELEKTADTLLPVTSIMSEVSSEMRSTLAELKSKADASTDIADKTFYLNRYTDLVKKVDSVFEARSKRLQQAIYTISKMFSSGVDGTTVEKETEDTSADLNSLTPEQFNKIFKIINEPKEEKSDSNGES